MRITFVMTLTILAVALSTGTASRAEIAQLQSTGPSMTFTGQVQGVDVGQGVVVVRGPKPGTQNGNASGQVSVIIMLTKVFKVDQTTTISVGGKSKPILADVKNGDPIQVSYVQSPNGQFLAKSVTDSGRPAAKQSPPSSYY
jgi:hypothetical protein